MPNAEEIRSAQRAAWAGLAPSWDKWDAVIVDQLRPVGDQMVSALGMRGGARHLDVASGTGEPGLTIARMAPDARVVLTDLAPEMLEIAAQRARSEGLGNVETRVCGADDLPFADGAFDSATLRFGYMFLPDLARATAEFARVLAPGGRLCASVWVDPDENPWTAVAMRAIASEVALPPADPDGPNMYRCAAPGQVAALYEDAGLGDVAEWDVGVELVVASPDEYWQMISEHVSLAAAALRSVDAPTRDRIRAKAIADVLPFERDGRIRVPGRARCIVGTKAGAGLG